MYTQALIDEVKRLYPDWDRAIKFAENGDAFLGRYLDDAAAAVTSIHYKKILAAASLQELQKEATIVKEKCELYAMWCDQDPRK